MARKTNSTPKALAKTAGHTKRKIEHYTHRKKRVNNPPVGLVTPGSDRDAGKRAYAYDPHLDPALQWAGKAERTSFEVPTVSFHVHERIDPRSIIEAVRKQNGENFVQGSLFSLLEENPPIREAIEFYKHSHNWSNRLIAGDNLLVMNSLLEKEGMAGKVQMIYIDPPYGIKYGSNFQPFVNKRDVKDGNDEDLTQEPEMIRAFRDTWELGIHSYLTYLRDRLLLAREFLHESGSCFVQISNENIHLVRSLMDDIFGTKNLAAMIAVRKTAAVSSPMARTNVLPTTCDYLIWYARDLNRIKYHQLYLPKVAGDSGSGTYSWVECIADRTRRRMTREEMQNPTLVPEGWKILKLDNLTSSGWSGSLSAPVTFQGKIYTLPPNLHWKTTPEGLQRLIDKGRVVPSGKALMYVRYFDDFPVSPLSDVWLDTGTGSFTEAKVYVVQTNTKVLTRCLLMTTDPGDLVFDPTCGSGTTAYVAEQWGRRWITCDTSRVAITLAKQRLMGAMFDYYRLARADEGVDSGFVYQRIQHTTLRNIANNEPPDQETLYDQPLIDRQRVRVTGPFTVEAVPAPVVMGLSEVDDGGRSADDSAARSGETQRQGDWRDALRKTGIRGKGGQQIEFSRVEPLPGTRWLHADAETKEDKPQRVVVSFGPQHAPLEQRQVALALGEAETLRPKPRIVVFAAFQFDPESAKDIDETSWPGVTLLKAQMNADLLTEDLKKKRASNESFWLIGHPDVDVAKIFKGEHKGKYQVAVNGFDYYNTVTGAIDSGGADQIAMWMLDPDYDGRSIFPRQVFFPMAGEDDGWAKLARNLKAEINENLIEAYRGTTSLPFEAGKHERAAVKIIDARGIESFKVVALLG
jgi:adenine-specific DNA-methyltransferase